MTAGERAAPDETAPDFDPFAGAALARVVPTTEPQREIWLAAKLDPAASLAYNEAVAIRLSGTLDVDKLRAALQQLVERHEALRATVTPDGADFCVAETVSLDCPLHDLSDLDETARAEAIAAAERRAVETPFDLEEGPLIRAELLRLASDAHLLIVAAHHIVCDGWSFGIVARDLAALYAQQLGGAAPAPADSFADYALAESAPEDIEARAADEQYWIQRFATMPPPLDLPVDHARPRRRGFASRREDRVLDAELVAEIKRAGAQRGASFFATLLAAFGILLERLTGQDDIVIGIPTAGQSVADQANLVGHCVNVLPLRASIDASQPFSRVLGDVRGQLLDLFEHQRYTFGTLLKRLAIARDPSRLALVSVLFNLDQVLDEKSVDFPGLDFALQSVPRTFENFELFINAVQDHGTLRLECQYNSELFDAVSVKRWLDAYEVLLRAAVANADTPAGALDLLSHVERATIAAMQPAPVAFDRHARMSDAFFAQAARTPQRAAVTFEGKATSYAELASRARAIASALRERGIVPGALVGLCLERGTEMVAAMLGVLDAGAAYVPLDPAYPRERLSFMASDAGLALVVADQAPGNVMDWPAERTLQIGEVRVASGDAPPPGPFDGESVAYVIYTSGSTGKPKGVRVPHRAVVNFLASMQREPGIRADDRLVAVTTLSFDISVLELMLPLGIGAEVVLASRAQAMDGPALIELLHDATMMQATPATWRLLIESGWNGGDDFVALSGGEALAPDLADALRARCGALWNMYGPTETTVWSTCERVEAGRGISIGKPIDNTRVFVVDANQKLVPLGAAGEIVIGGDGVTLGYLNRDELTRERFIADPMAPERIAYRTGDRGRWRTDGRLEHLGRLDFQVKLRGYRIELGEIEAAVIAQGGFARAVAITREDRPGDVRLVVYVTLAPGAKLDEITLRQRLRDSLPQYMIPQHFVPLAAIPLLPNGKVDRKALPPPVAAAHAPSAKEAGNVPPRDETERRVLTAMEETLALPGLGIHDDFFAFGGHSLLAAQLTARLNREFDTHLSLRALFDAPTAAGLAEAVAATRAKGGGSRRIAHRADQRRAPLSLLQKRLWLFEQLDPGSVVYNTPSAHRLIGVLDEIAFERAFNEMIRRQAVLRTSIGHDGEDVVQRVEDHVAVKLFPAEDLSGLDRESREADLLRQLEELTNVPFDLAVSPLFRAKMFRLGPEEHALLFMPHHIVWDGWSFDLFYEEFSRLYTAYRNDETPKLPPPAVSYGDFAAWHEEWLRGAEYAEEFEAQRERWYARLVEHGAPVPIATDRPCRTGMAATADIEWVTLPKAATEALREIGRAADATMFMTLLAAYVALLYRMIGDGNIVVGTPVRVRSSSDIEQVMGLFTNLLPLAVDVDPSMRFDGLVRHVKNVVLDSFAYPDVQLEDVMRDASMKEVAGSSAPFYQAQFSYQDARQRTRDWGGLAQSQIPLSQKAATEDLAVWVLEHVDGMIGGVLYNADIFTKETMQRLASRFLGMLDRIVADPQQTVGELARAPDDEIEQLREWNASGAIAPVRTTVHALFEAAADAQPSKVALTSGSWGTSYAEVEQRANRIAGALAKRGVANGTVVALAAEHGINRVAALLGTLKAGGACVLLDPRDPAERLRDLLADSQAAVLVADAALGASLQWPEKRALYFDADAPEIIAMPVTRVAPPVDPDQLALAIHVAAPGGTSRGACYTHAALAQRLRDLGALLHVGTDDRVLATAPPASALSIIETLLPLACGAELAQATREDIARSEPLGSLAANATLAFAAPEFWRALAVAHWAGNTRLRIVSTGAPAIELARQLAPLSAELWCALVAVDGGIVASAGRFASGEAVQCGKPLPGTSVAVLDEAGRICPIGATGDIAVGGSVRARAFGQRAPTIGADALVETGLRAAWNSAGVLVVREGASRRLRISGMDVEPAGIEARLLASPGVAEAVVFVHEEGGTLRLVACVAAAPGAKLDGEALRASLETALPAHEVPRHVLVVDALPRTARGDIDIARIPIDGLAADTGTDAASQDAPKSPQEKLLASIWSELLEIPAISVRDNFFDLGGHSLMAMTMVAKVEKATGVRLNFLKIANSSLRVLAASLPEDFKPHEPSGVGNRLRGLFGRITRRNN
ncbi:MAG TPA: amino acid adenylation domain-containing protein [Rhodanobacteraceae bacterium]|nr:amino acid adenylation domain-containing protein [Rhodanobacteraceae bacterium]